MSDAGCAPPARCAAIPAHILRNVSTKAHCSGWLFFPHFFPASCTAFSTRDQQARRLALHTLSAAEACNAPALAALSTDRRDRGWELGGTDVGRTRVANTRPALRSQTGDRRKRRNAPTAIGPGTERTREL